MNGVAQNTGAGERNGMRIDLDVGVRRVLCSERSSHEGHSAGSWKQESEGIRMGSMSYLLAADE
jgi:hypothetical protein